MSNLSISILSVENISCFLDELKEYEQKLSNIKTDELFNITIHFDVMDNVFVPNTGIDIEKIKIVKDNGFYVDTHLMVAKPVEDGYIDKAIENGCRDITIHYEIENFEYALNYLINKKNELNGDFKIGVSIKPKTEISCLEKYIEKIDKVLIMSVEPGFGGQKYIDSVTKKVEELNTKYKNKYIQIDGGINDETIIYPIRNNINSIVVGSYLTKSIDDLFDKICILNIIKQIEKLPKEADINFETKILNTPNILLGIKVPTLRKLTKVWYNIISQKTLSYFIKSNIHDYRRFAVFCLAYCVNKDNKENIKAFIDEHIEYLNSWDLVDACAPICIGKQLINESEDKIYNILRIYTKSDNIFIKRVGIVSLLYLAKENRYKAIFKVIDDVFYDEYHLIQKANGWVLRELYKVNSKEVLKYLVNKNNIKKIPSILKSYAIEKMNIDEKQMLK